MWEKLILFEKKYILSKSVGFYIKWRNCKDFEDISYNKGVTIDFFP